MTIEDRLIACQNRPAGFDYMRLFLSSAVLLSHVTNVLLGAPGMYRDGSGPLKPFLLSIVPMFFALSGFLVAGSLDRCRTMVSFLGLRLIRLLPALAVDTVLAVLVLGPLFTTLPLAEYFASPVTHAYLLNIVGDVHMLLPGVFETNIFPNIVNGQLWTLPFELICYVTLTLLAVIGCTRDRRAYIAATCVIVALLWIVASYHRAAVGQVINGQDGRATLLQCFLLGAAAYLYRDRLPFSTSLFLLSFAIMLTALSVPGWDYFSAPAIVYVTVYLGVLEPRRTRLVSSGDYSYGIYLYGFPIQQALAAAVPSWPGPVHIVLAFALTFSLAAASWWFVEKPALRLRPRLFRVETRIAQWVGGAAIGRFLIRPPIAPPLQRPPAREAS